MIPQTTSTATLTVLLPLLLTFTPVNDQQQRWWQRSKQPTPAEVLQTHTDSAGKQLIISFTKGEEHNHPLMAFWTEDTAGNYLQSLYVAQSIAKGYFRHGDASSGRWQPGPLRRPAALPYWGHQRGVEAPDGYFIPTQDEPMPDAVTGPTPKADFVIQTTLKATTPKVFNIYMEINQSWDWNQHWHNNKFPGDEHYMTSSQPALVYKVTIDTSDPQNEYIMHPIGHSHWAGATGELFDDLSTITTALNITEKVKVQLKQNP